ncbi:mdis1-interacting receptor like kinase 2, partial [Quercus suber]
MAWQRKQLRVVSFTLLFAWSVLLSSCKANPRSTAEAEALLRWKKSLPDQPILKSWVAHTNSTALSPCKWRGIACNDEGSVTEIYLNYTGLKGTLENLDLSSFPNLLSLDLKENQLTGTIPTNIGTLYKLKFLDLSTNSLNGSLPLSLANLTQVYELDLSRNNITGELDPLLFPDATSQSKTGLLSLKNFLLQDNMLGGRIPGEIGNLKYLDVLALDGNYFCGPIPQSIVQLQYNQLTGHIDQDLGVYPNLNYIDLSYNRLQGKLSPNWVESKNLTLLRLAGNMMSGQIPSEIVQLSKMVKLDLSSNQFSGNIPAEIGTLSKLSNLILKDNKLSGEVPAGIGGLSNLVSLDLSMNLLSGPIPDEIEGCWKLQELWLSKNYLNGTIPYQIGNLQALQDLDLSFNSLIGEIPPQLGSLSDLEYLNLSNNNLHGLVPTSLGSMMSLVGVNLSNNNLEGPLPEGKIFESGILEAFSNNKDLCGKIQGLRRCDASVVKKGGGNKKSKIVVVIVASLVSALSLSFAFVGIFAYLQKRHSRNMKDENTSKTEHPFSIWYFDGRAVYKDILEASKNFDDMYCIGVGSSAKVYKVKIPGGQELAVKKLSSQAESIGTVDIKSFTNELAALTEIRHRNIVKLLGFCFHEVHTFFIYEFMEKGSLADMLCGKEAKDLGWSTRIQTIKSVANALSYMHHDCVPPIIHRDISSKNVLLSIDLEAYVSDFGTARFLKPDSSNWTTIAGTYGYLAPDNRLSPPTSQKIVDELAQMLNLA